MDNINVDKLIDDVIKELQIGVVNTEVKYRMKINLNTSSHFETTPTLQIKDKEVFYNNIKEYVSLFADNITFQISDEKEMLVKKQIAYLFANMSIDDFTNPEEYVRRVIDFNKNRVLRSKVLGYSNILESNIEVHARKYNVETPFCFETKLVNNDNCAYDLPTISYGISDNTCYIYAIQDYNKHEKNPYYNKIKRKLYKLNSNVLESETEEYKEYKSGESEYYPENISDVSPSAILALTLFLNELEKNGINKIKVIPYLPVRFDNKTRCLAYKTLKEAKQNNLSNEEKRKLYLELVNQQMLCQSNMTEKLIRNFYRLAHHFDNIQITSIPYELDDGLHLKVDTFEYTDNEILNEIINLNNKTR